MTSLTIIKLGINYPEDKTIKRYQTSNVKKSSFLYKDENGLVNELSLSLHNTLEDDKNNLNKLSQYILDKL